MSRHAAAPARRDRRSPRLSASPSPAAPLSAADLIARHRAGSAPADVRGAVGLREAQVTPRSTPATRGPRHGAPVTGRRASLPSLPAFARPNPIKVITRPALIAAAVVATVAAVGASEAPVTMAAADQARGGGSPSGVTSATGADTATGVSLKSTPPNPTTTTAADPAARKASSATSTTTRISRAKRVAKAPRALSKPGQTVAGVWVKPNPGPMTSCFCMRWGTMHWGVDLAGPRGSAILAVGDGVVLDAGPQDGFGNWVVIRHSNGDVSIYGHMLYYFVQVGQKVKAGEKIALVGSEGQSTGPHLHFEIHKGGLDGVKVDPIPWLKARGITVGPYDPNG